MQTHLMHRPATRGRTERHRLVAEFVEFADAGSVQPPAAPEPAPTRGAAA
ncbi:hypothetical protein AB0O18_11305 [Streptomyces sp. NPDC093224]